MENSSDATVSARPDSREALGRLNELPREEALAALLACCGARRWAEAVADERPFHDEARLFESADRVWWSLRREDWLEAFRSHPKIGERKVERATGEAARNWSEQEQSAAARGATRETLGALAEANRVYENRFGHIFIVCATGKTSDEMLELLRRRLPNEPDAELRIAAEEQRRITRLRLRKLLGADNRPSTTDD